VRRLTDEQLRETGGLIGSERGAAQLDLLVGGFPCQGASVAGKRLGLADDRTALFWEIIRVQKIVRAPWALLENVPGLRSVRFGHDFAICLAALKELWPVVGWRTFDSRFFHVAQRRERVFFVCGPTEAGVASVLFELEGGGGHPAAGDEAGTGLAGPLGGGAYGAGRRDEDDPNLVFAPLSAGSHDASHAPGRRREDDVNLVVANGLTGRYGKGTDSDASDTLIAPTLNGYHGRNQVEGAYAVVGVSENQRAELRLTDVSRQITSGGGKPGQGYPAAMVGSLVRRLTPLECERLQNFPDGWTCLCQPLTAYAADPDAAALACTCPDSPRYRALGNAVTVSVIEWLGRRLT
jgi:DNA (cytosine-5)-methyltransferase 1